MSLLTVTNLNHGFGDREIFDNVSFRLLAGEHIGLIGANGQGKSTFMNIITGKLEADSGTVSWSKKVRIGYLDQHTVLKEGMTIRDALRTAFQYLYDMESEMNELFAKMGDVDPDELEKLLEETGQIQDDLDQQDFYILDSKVDEVANGLGLDEFGLDKDVNDLSGGQRTKVLLAKLLLEKPDVLLLDEPTNYLDVEHIEWLRNYLDNYPNAFVLISHDIPFLNSVVNLIYHMENQEITRYPGNHDEFLRVHEMKKLQTEAAFKKQQKEIAGLKDFVARNKARASTSGIAKSRQKKLEKIDVIELDSEKPKPHFNFKTSRAPSKYLFDTKKLVIGYDEPLSSPLDLAMERGQKIALSGANGIGKTTLLKSLLGEIPALSGEVERGEYLSIGYFEQELKSDSEKTCLEEMWSEFPSFTQNEVRGALARVGLTNKHIESKVKVLSGGERAKVRLCKLINQETNLLVLDEPTNHLDVDAKAELKRALTDFKGSVLLISHEPDFYEGVVNNVWNGETWTTKEFQ